MLDAESTAVTAMMLASPAPRVQGESTERWKARCRRFERLLIDVDTPRWGVGRWDAGSSSPEDTNWRDPNTYRRPASGDQRNQITLAQKVRWTGPSSHYAADIALIDARKGLKMFEKVGSPTLRGENMSYTSAPRAATKAHLGEAAPRRVVALGTEILARLRSMGDPQQAESATHGCPTDGAVDGLPPHRAAQRGQDRWSARQTAKFPTPSPEHERRSSPTAGSGDGVRGNDRALDRPRYGARRARVVSYGNSSTATTPLLDEFKSSHGTRRSRYEERRREDFVDTRRVCTSPNSSPSADVSSIFPYPRSVLTICLGKSTYARCGSRQRDDTRAEWEATSL